METKKTITISDKIKKAFEVALDRELLGIDFQMNVNSLKQDLEEIKNPLKSEGRKEND